MTLVEHFAFLLHLTSEGLLILLIHCIIFIGLLLLRFQLSQFSGKISVTCSSNFLGWSSKLEHQKVSCKKQSEALPLAEDKVLQCNEENWNFNLSHSQSLENLLKNCFNNKSVPKEKSFEENCQLSRKVTISEIYKNQQDLQNINVYNTPAHDDDLYKHPNLFLKKIKLKTEIEHSFPKGFLEANHKNQNCNFNEFQNFDLPSCSSLDANIRVLECPGVYKPSLLKHVNHFQEPAIIEETDAQSLKENNSVDIQYKKSGRSASGKLNFSGCICELLGYSRCSTQEEVNVQSCVSKEILERKIHSENNSLHQLSDDEIPSTNSSIAPENDSLQSESNEFSSRTSSQTSSRSQERRFDSGMDSSFIYESSSQTVIILQLKENVSLIHSRKISNTSSVSNGYHKENQVKFLPQIRSLLEKSVLFRRFSLDNRTKQKTSFSNFIKNHRRHSSPVIPAIKYKQYDALETLLTKMRNSGKFRLL